MILRSGLVGPVSRRGMLIDLPTTTFLLSSCGGEDFSTYEKIFKSFLSMGDRIVIQCHSSGTKSRTITRQARSDGQYEDLTKIWVPFRGVRSMVLLPTASFEL